jgi:hypothetical protein
VSTERTAGRLIVALVVLASASAMATEDPALEVETGRTTLRVGDRLEVLASARGGDGWLWGEVTVAIEPGGAWEVVDGPAAVAGSRPPAWKLVLAPMELGELELPKITATVRPPDGPPAEVGVSAATTVTVSSVLSDEEEDRAPAPLRDPIGARGFPWEWVLPIAVLALPLLGAAAWLWSGRGRAAAGIREVATPFAELEALSAELGTRVGRDPAEGICDRLAAGLRRYLERRTGEPAEEMTSFELRLLARRRGWPETTQRLVQRVMGVADGVRFGRRPTTDDELLAAVSSALDAGRSVEDHLAPADVATDSAGAGS